MLAVAPERGAAGCSVMPATVTVATNIPTARSARVLGRGVRHAPSESAASVRWRDVRLDNAAVCAARRRRWYAGLEEAICAVA